MNTRLAFEDYTALHHRLDSLRAIDEVPEKSQLEFENRRGREQITEDPSQFVSEAKRLRAIPDTTIADTTIADTTLADTAIPAIKIRDTTIPDTMEQTIQDVPELAIETRRDTTREMTRQATREPEEKAPAMWRSILQLRVLLPYVSKLLPLLESSLTGAHTPAQNTGLAAVEKSSLEMQNSNRELRLQLQDQAIEFKRVDEQLERLREATERNTLEQQELIEDLRAVAGTIKMVGWTAVALLIGLIGAVVYVAVHLKQ